jgi:rhodanese-related sulfurtransferase
MWPIVLVGIALATLAPLGIYALVWGGAPEISAEEALGNLTRQDATAVLVDVRPEAARANGRIRGAVSWPLAEIEALAGTGDVPPSLQGETLYLVCDAGLSSAVAARRLAQLGVEEAYSIAGGLQAWVRVCAQHEASEFCSWGSPEGGWGRAPFRSMTMGEQWGAVLSAFVVKPLYMLGALILIVMLVGRGARDLRFAQWGMISFLAGETCCAINYIFFQGSSLFLDYWHASGMVVAFGFVALAAMEGLDARFLHLTEQTKPCVSLRMCGACIKNRDAPCAARRGFLLISGVAATLTFIPMLAPIRAAAYNTMILGMPYSYWHPVLLQLFETRYCPGLALVLLAGAFGFLLAVKNRPASAPARALFAAGAGALGFGLFRLALGSMFEGNLVWASFWEELTELELVLGIGAVLWFFRDKLLARDTRAVDHA